MRMISAIMGIEHESLTKTLNFLPYPVLLSELRNGQQHNIFVNKSFIDEIGYTCDDIPTINAWFTIAYPDAEYRNTIISDWSKLVEEAKSKQIDFITKQAQIKTKFNGEKWFEVKASLQGAINIVAFVNIDKEITREKKLELLNENKDRTLSILSHDLRAPLASLYSALQLLTENALSESEKSLILTKLTRQVFQMMEFLDTTLQWTRTNFSDQKPVHEAVDLKEIFENILGLYSGAIEEKKLEVVTSVKGNDQTFGDPQIFSILLRNLISNAVKYTPILGKILLALKQDRNALTIEVENSGPAITKATIDGILNKQYNSQRGTQGEKGLGIGLKLCQQLLENAGGRMEIESPSTDRTVFRIIFPLEPQSKASQSRS
jgi:signal transduction histidine kinase